MIGNLLSEKLLKSFKFELTNDQKKLVIAFSEFCVNLATKTREVFIVKGYAGTGKTTIMSKIVNLLEKQGIKSVLLAPTGRAAKVFSLISGKNAYTIHKKIYKQKSSKDGFGSFVLNKNLHKNTIFFIDEASMVSNTSIDKSLFGTGKLLDDIINYVYEGNNCRLVLIGDVAQLPPVGLELSPALDSNEIESFGVEVTEVELSQVVRQTEKSGILSNASVIRHNISDNILTIPNIETISFKDIKRISGEDLIEFINSSYDKTNISDTIVVCRSNKRANTYNKGIREQILWKEEEISVGDLLMVVKNNYYWTSENEKLDFIANGDIVEINRIKNYEERYGYRFANITVSFIDYENLSIDVKIILNSIYIERAAFNYDENKEFYYKVLEDYNNIKNKREQYKAIREDPYFNALQVKFAYAITCHKAQGGQWKNVFLDQGYFREENINVEYLRWLYTAFTRATENLYLVNFPNKFFSNEESSYF